MKTEIFLIGLAVFFFPFFRTATASAETKKIILGEIQISGITANDEFVRFKNETDAAIDLAGFKLTKKSVSSGSCKESSLVSTIHFAGILAPQDTFTIAHPSYKEALRADLEYSSASYYLSDNTAILLYDTTGTLLDRKAVGNACDIPVVPANPPITPPVPDPPAPIAYDTALRLNEFLPDPSGDEGTNEFIELYNASDETADLASWALKDASASGKYIFPDGTKLKPKDFLAVYRNVFTFALNNSNETLSLLDPNGTKKDTVAYTTSKEDISWNYTSSGWRGGAPTPGAANQLNNLPETKEKVPKKGYRGVAIDFDAQGNDDDRDTLKYAWDFGDGHKSYKEQTSHTFEENGTYTVTLKTSDNKEDVRETFTLEIESLPHPEVRITSLLPNPNGSDTDHEWLMIENREKKTINLKDYSIATGWKTLSNHPIREDFPIKPKSEAKLTRAVSLFTLPNQKGKIELRAPDGKTLQKIQYKSDKSIPENTLYRKEKGSTWKWAALAQQIPTTSEKEAAPISSPPLEGKPEEALSPREEDAPSDTIKRNQLSLDPDRPIPQDILAYGTHTEIPDTIILKPFPAKEALPLSATRHYAVAFVGTAFSDINASLNDLLARAR
ncbi:MAG: lamin tail domain-containing protein [Candidatus Moraniibacteriota bacterium]